MVRERRAELLVALARERDADARLTHATALCDLAAQHPQLAQEFVPDVPLLLSDRMVPVRRCGLALAATVLPPDDALSLLAERTGDPEEEIRTEAVGRLADLALPAGRPALATALADRSFAVRFEAARGMAALMHPAGLPVLVEGLSRDAYRFRALGALAELSDARAVEPVRAVFKRWLLPGFERTQAAGVLAKLGDPEGAQHLFKVASGRWGTDRALAVELCGEVRVPGAFGLLEGLVRSVKDPCRGAAARGLGRLGDPNGMGALRELFTDTTVPEDLRLDAAEGMFMLDARAARPVLTAGLSAFGREARAELADLLKSP